MIETKWGKRIGSADLLRIVCIIIIFLCHAWLLPDSSIRTINSNATGKALEIFFILSGCFVAIHYQKVPDVTTKSFFLHNLKKIYPQYLLSHFIVLVYETVLFIRGGYIPKGGEGYFLYELVKKLIVTLLMLNSWLPKEEYIYAFNGVGWFCSSLMFCYLVTPCLLRKMKSPPVAQLLLVLSIRSFYVSVVHYLAVGNSLYFLSVLPIYRLMEYMAGMCLGKICLCWEGRVKGSIAQIISIVLFVLLIVIDSIVSSFGSLFIVFEIMLVFSLVCFYGVVDKIASVKLIKVSTKALLSFYLFHQIVIKIYKYTCAVAGVQLQNAALLHMIIMFVLSVLVGYLIYIYCEKGADRKKENKKAKQKEGKTNE